MKGLLKNTFLRKAKSNRGFTMQDVAIGIIVLLMCAGTIAGAYMAIYKMQAQTRVTAVASLYGIQIIENIDRIRYDEVTDPSKMAQDYRKEYDIPEAIGIRLDRAPYGEDDIMKKVTLTLDYEIAGSKETLVLEKLKVKEI